jgi:outer membrane lipoprotein-sorting protein
MVNNWRRWTPAVVAVVVVAGVAVAVPVAANASVSLPSKTPAQVLELIQSSKVTAFSGEITETSDLGLPTLSVSGASTSGSAGGGAGGSDSSIASDLALITGTNSLRVYVDGSKNIRLQDLESLGEQDLIRHGNDVWTYDSKTNAVEHATLSGNDLTGRSHIGTPAHIPSGSGLATPGSSVPASAAPGPSAWGGSASRSQAENNSVVPTTPEAIAQVILAKLRGTSTVSVSDNVRVAGRAAYDLVLTPKATDTLIGSVSIAVDAATGLPLRVQVDAAGQKTPAVSIGFSSLALQAPNASLFDFTPPTGATVKQLTTTRPDGHGKPDSHAHAKPSGAKPTVTGKGWDAVVTVSDSGGSLAGLSSSPEFAELTEAVSGGRVLHTSLFNVLFTSDGRIVAGAVSVSRLEAVAAQ